MPGAAGGGLGTVRPDVGAGGKGDPGQAGSAEGGAEGAAVRLCGDCGKVPAVEGGYRCEGCRAKQREKSRSRRTALAAMGRCVQCGKEEPAPGFRLCPTCQEYRAEWIRRYREQHGTVREQAYRRTRERRLIEAGRCPYCGERLAPGRKRCGICLAKRAEAERLKRRQRAEAGLCRRCGQPPDTGQALCSGCRAILEQYQRRRTGPCEHHPWRLHPNSMRAREYARKAEEAKRA